jgi:hypothetical protein
MMSAFVEERGSNLSVIPPSLITLHYKPHAPAPIPP